MTSMQILKRVCWPQVCSALLQRLAGNRSRRYVEIFSGGEEEFGWTRS